MKYEISYNQALQIWEVWRGTTYGDRYYSELVKRFKTRKGAENWVAKR